MDHNNSRRLLLHLSWVVLFGFLLGINPGDDIGADSNGACSLRAAIGEANALAGVDDITLRTGTYTLTLPGTEENNNLTGDLDILSQITITGAAARETVINANHIDQVLQVHETGNLILNNITLMNGSITDDGGGINNAGMLALHNTTVTSNTISGSGSYGVASSI